jgi:hypothetical protein
VRRSTLSRVSRLEARQPQPVRPVHFIFIRGGEDGEAIREALIAAGEADKDDRFWIYEFVSPRPEDFSGLPVVPPEQAVAAWRDVAEPYRPDGSSGFTNKRADRAPGASAGLVYWSAAAASLG